MHDVSYIRLQDHKTTVVRIRFLHQQRQVAKSTGQKGLSKYPLAYLCAEVLSIMSPYSYSRLPKGGDYIRLLRLMPFENESTEGTRLHCELFNYRLQDTYKGTHPYEALSYTWGEEEKRHSIFVKGQALAITTNLHAALLRLRHNSLVRIIWADAICIDQEHKEEKGQQVPLMPMIYSKAHSVLVWLGETTDSGDGALKDIQRAAYEESTEDLAEKMTDKAIFQLLQRQWFQRIWVREKTFYPNSKTTLMQFF